MAGLCPMVHPSPRLAFSDTVFMRSDLGGFLRRTLRKSEQQDAVAAVRELRCRGYPIAGFEWVDRTDALQILRTRMPEDAHPVSIHGPIFPTLRSLETSLADAPSLWLIQEMLGEFAISGTFHGRAGLANPLRHIHRLEEIANFYSADDQRVPITLHPYCINVLGRQGLFPRPAGSPRWAIEPDFPRPNQRRARALITDLSRVMELAHTFGCSINFDTSHLRLSGHDLINSWERIYDSKLRVEVMHLVGSGSSLKEGKMRGGMELSGHVLSPRDLREHAEFLRFVESQGWNGLVVIELSATQMSGSTTERLDALLRTLDFYMGDYDAFLSPPSFSFPNSPSVVQCS